PRPTKLLTASSFSPCFIPPHSPWQRAGGLLVVYFTAQRCSALPRNSSSEQERPVRSAVLIWSSSAGHTPQRPWPLRRTPTAWNDRARTVFAISWLSPSDRRIPPANASRWRRSL